MSLFESMTGQGPGECKALLDTCTPFVYLNNAFRTTGLNVDATTREVKRRIDDLKAAHAMGESEEEHIHAFALKPPPDLNQIRQAAQKLQDPERRIIEEFFWFWPSEWGKGKSDPALTALAKGDRDAAFNTWSYSVADGQAPESVVAEHNLAVMYHAIALDGEQALLNGSVSAGQLEAIAEYWQACFRYWEELTDDETFWSMITDRIRLLDDPRLTTGFARRMRATFPEALDKINAMLALQFVELGKLDLAKKHITYMKETHQGLDDVPKTLRLVSEPLMTRIRTAVQAANATAGSQPAAADKAAHNLINAAGEAVQVLEVVFSTNDIAFIDVCDSVAEACMACGWAFAQVTENWEAALYLFQKAEGFARSDDLKAQVRKAKRQAQEHAALSHPKAKQVMGILERVKTLDRLEQVEEIYRSIPPLLWEIRGALGASSRAYTYCADAVAGKLRNIAVEIYNSVDSSALPGVQDRAFGDGAGRLNIAAMADCFFFQPLLSWSLEIHDRAASLACGEELKAVFRKDEVSFGPLRNLMVARGLRETMRPLTEGGVLPSWTVPSWTGPVESKARSASPPRKPGQRAGVSASHRQKARSSGSGCLAAFVLVGVAIVLYFLFGSDSGTPSSNSRVRNRPSRYTSLVVSPGRSGTRRVSPAVPRSRNTAVRRPAFQEPVQPLPGNGWLVRHHTEQAIAPLRITTGHGGAHYYVKIKNYYSKSVVATVFVRSGSTVNFDVPTGSYSLQYACGKTWYGTGHLFGPDTAYAKADERFDFQVIGNQVSGYEVGLYPRADGKLKRIVADQALEISALKDVVSKKW